MATLTLTIGNLTATINTPDANATEISRAMLESDGHDLSTMTNQEQIEAALRALVSLANNKARINEVRKAAAAAIIPVFEQDGV